MTDKKNKPRKTAKADTPQAAPITDLPAKGNEPWMQWKVKPDLVPILGDWPARESGIPKRIAYCRGQLNNLSVEALARYTKYFDPTGISKASIVRYESGDSFPGARELRILCDALWVSSDWLLLGTLDLNLQNPAAVGLIDALTDFVQGVSDKTNEGFIFAAAGDLRKANQKTEIEKRQRWIDEARKPTPR